MIHHSFCIYLFSLRTSIRQLEYFRNAISAFDRKKSIVCFESIAGSGEIFNHHCYHSKAEENEYKMSENEKEINLSDRFPQSADFVFYLRKPTSFSSSSSLYSFVIQIQKIYLFGFLACNLPDVVVQ